MLITTLLHPDLVIADLPAALKDEVLDALAVQVGRVHPRVDVRTLSAALRDRERQSTTALEHGVALPHARLGGVLEAPLAALARTAAGIPCGAVDGHPTRLFLLLVVPAEQPGAHLRMLANAARLLSNARCRSRLLEAPTATDLLAAFREHEERGVAGLRAA